MSNKYKDNKVATKFMPFLAAGLAVVLFVFGLIIFSWILIVAACAGLVLFIISSISAKFSKQKNNKSPQTYDPNQPQHGRTIDQDDDTNPSN